MGAREGSTDLLDKLNEAIALMKADGSLNELLNGGLGRQDLLWAPATASHAVKLRTHRASYSAFALAGDMSLIWAGYSCTTRNACRTIATALGIDCLLPISINTPQSR